MKRSRRSDRREQAERMIPQEEQVWEEDESYPPEEVYPPEEMYPPEDVYPPGDAYASDEEDYAEDYPPMEEEAAAMDDPYWDDLPLTDDDDDPLPEEKPHPRSIFKPRVKKPSFILCVLVNVVRIFAVLILVAGLAAVGAVAGIAKGYVETAPSLDLAALDDQAQTSFIYDSQGKLITEYKGVENRVMVSLAAMPRYLQQAFVAVEDARFYTHSGIDVKRIVGAFVSNLTSSSTQGGSTITQQLIKNTLLSSEQSYKRKIQEAYLALQLETRYSKDEILECYLNTIWLGESYYGVQTAAEGYFGKSLAELTLRECAMLAGTCNSPYYYNPRRNFYTRSKEGVDYPAITNNRTDYVLRCMYENQFITYEQYQEALDPATAQVLETDPTASSGMYAHAHYVEYAVEEVVDILLELNGLEDTPQNRSAMENKLRTGGYHVKLAIDTSIQTTVQETMENWTKYPSLRDPSDKIFQSRNPDGTYDEIIQPQAAAVVLDYRTGEIKAIVGSRTTPTARKTLNRATDMRMPVGSSIKPIAVYAPALELGSSPASIVFNMPLPISGWKDSNGRDTWPKNYGGGGYTGPTTLRYAMKKSLNTAAAQTLMTLVGTDRSVDFLHRLGVDDNHIDATPFGLSLGSSGITPLQMTVAFGVLANGGVYQEPISVLGISDSEGNVVWDGHANQERRRVFSESTSWLIVDMLEDAVSSGTGTTARIKGQTVAGKTGTNSDQKGVFFSGMTGYYASSVWVGHDNYKALSSKSTGSGAAAPLWQSFMSKIHSGLASRDILEGDPSQYGLTTATTCAVSGQLATDACRADAMGYGTVTDYWAQGTVPTVYCQMHQTQTVCTESGMAAGPYCPSTSARGTIVIPKGHPLYQYVGSSYSDVLTEYLGGTAGYSGESCTWHTSYSPSGSDPVVNNTLIPDAQVLLSQAQSMLSGMDSTGAHFAAIVNAMNYLNGVIQSPNPSQAEVANAMGLLTQAMAGIY
ncbi:MAG: PBP1A family penicillin-binding protein [Clostridia bacterium]|nr:PBP1A family penicillin-binding protein [Clostridia bacterium]